MKTDVMSDFCDGEYYRNHNLFSTHRNALQIMMYYDDVEVCNPLGSHTKIHKLGKYIVLYITNTIYMCLEVYMYTQTHAHIHTCTCTMCIHLQC